MSFEVKGGLSVANQVMSRIKLPVVAPSLGGVESLITRPAPTSHSGISATDRRKLGISDELIRFSVGLEATEDLIQDLKNALS